MIGTRRLPGHTLRLILIPERGCVRQDQARTLDYSRDVSMLFIGKVSLRSWVYR